MYLGILVIPKLTSADTKTAIKIEYHAVGDTWWQPLLSYGNCIWLI